MSATIKGSDLRVSGGKTWGEVEKSFDAELASGKWDNYFTPPPSDSDNFIHAIVRTCKERPLAPAIPDPKVFGEE